MRKARRILAGVMCLMALAGAGVAIPKIEAYAAESISVNIESEVWGKYYVGETLTATVYPQNVSCTYQWYRCSMPCTTIDEVKNKATLINGAVSDTYTMQAEDVKNYLHIIATETEDNSGTMAYTNGIVRAKPISTATDVIEEYDLKASITGKVVPGQTVGVSVTGTINGRNTNEYQWYLDGEIQEYWSINNKTYTIPADAKGKKLYVEVSNRYETDTAPFYVDVCLKSDVVTIGEPGNDTPDSSDGKLTDSSKDIQYETNDNLADEIYAGANKSVEAHVTQGAQFTVIIPRKIVLDGKSGSGDYDVIVMGDIPGNQEINVEPKESTFTMTTVGKPSVTANITQNKTKFSVALDTMEGLKTGTVAGGTIEADGLTAGKWTGIFNFAISVNETAA